MLKMYIHEKPYPPPLNQAYSNHWILVNPNRPRDDVDKRK